MSNKKWNRSGIYIDESNLPLRAHKAKMVQRVKRQGKCFAEYVLRGAIPSHFVFDTYNDPGPNGIQVSAVIERRPIVFFVSIKCYSTLQSMCSTSVSCQAHARSSPR